MTSHLVYYFFFSAFVTKSKSVNDTFESVFFNPGSTNFLLEIPWKWTLRLCQMVINVLEQWSSTGIQRNTKLPLVSARGAGQMLDLHIIYCESYSYLICLELVF